MIIQVNLPYLNRIVMELGSLDGPLASVALGAFSAIRDLTVYVDGVVTAVHSFNFDAVGNRYLIFTTQPFDVTGVVQVVHHMPASPFLGSNGTLVGFSATATFSDEGDAPTPEVDISAPATVVQFQEVPILWTAIGVAQFEITCTNGYNSGALSAANISGTVFEPGIQTTGEFEVTIAGLDSEGNPVTVNGSALTSTFSLVVTADVSSSIGFGLTFGSYFGGELQ